MIPGGTVQFGLPHGEIRTGVITVGGTRADVLDDGISGCNIPLLVYEAFAKDKVRLLLVPCIKR